MPLSEEIQPVLDDLIATHNEAYSLSAPTPSEHHRGFVNGMIRARRLFDEPSANIQSNAVDPDLAYIDAYKTE